MPVWHEATKDLQAEGEVQMVGIIQEQHPDRCRLFMQWKRMDWPVMVDSLNVLQVSAVPLTFLIDEHGIIRDMPSGRGDITETVQEFIGKEFEAPTAVEPADDSLDPRGKELPELRRIKALVLASRGVEAVQSGDPGKLDAAIELFHEAMTNNPNPGLTLFQLGVAYRKRFDSAARHPDDFEQAVSSWQSALFIDPNQYIWRRRIQQYGPRLMKPYPFYDWVPTAREEIAARGETPAELAVEPSGAEYAQPERSFSTVDLDKANPDPEGRILRDERGFIEATVVVVPSVVKAGEAVRVHLVLTPDSSPPVKAHWNNEVDDTVLWITPPNRWRVDRQWSSIARPKSIVSTETRKVEFELSVPEGTEPGVVRIPAYALYYVCEDVGGKCLYRRLDIDINVEVVD